MPTLPPLLTQIEDPAIRSTVERLWELADRLQTRLEACEASLAAQNTTLARIPVLEQQLKKQDADLQRIRN